MRMSFGDNTCLGCRENEYLPPDLIRSAIGRPLRATLSGCPDPWPPRSPTIRPVSTAARTLPPVLHRVHRGVPRLHHASHHGRVADGDDDFVTADGGAGADGKHRTVLFGLVAGTVADIVERRRIISARCSCSYSTADAGCRHDCELDRPSRAPLPNFHERRRVDVLSACAAGEHQRPGGACRSAAGRGARRRRNECVARDRSRIRGAARGLAGLWHLVPH